jgi:hypothetical protein
VNRAYQNVKVVVVLPTMLTPQGPATMTATYEKAKHVEIDQFGAVIESETGEFIVWNREAYQRIEVDPHGSIIKQPGILKP